ncbi:hypothetical protein MP228_012221 [Amoeboaphelidium protococcarum]|nr:hypothetical protein MP228_012221 [Amoeboaphelidium protococcarum]
MESPVMQEDGNTSPQMQQQPLKLKRSGTFFSRKTQVFSEDSGKMNQVSNCSFYTASETLVEDVLTGIDQSETRQSSPESNDGRHKGNFNSLQALIKDFRQEIAFKSKTVMAFGIKHPNVFTGADAIELIQRLVGVHLPQLLSVSSLPSQTDATNISQDSNSNITQNDQLCSVEVAQHVANYLSNKYFILIPCTLQLNKATQDGAEVKPLLSHGRDIDGLIKAIDDANDPLDGGDSLLPAMISKNYISICNDNTTLYRLWKDALLSYDFTQFQFDQWCKYILKSNNAAIGVPLKIDISKKLYRRAFTPQDKVFSERQLNKWLQDKYDVHDESQFNAIKQLLLTRKVIQKVPLMKCYHFI